MDIKLTKLTKLGFFFYGTYKGLRVKVCNDELSEYFDMSDDPKTITIRVTHKEVLNSYLLTRDDVCWQIHLSDKSSAITAFAGENDDVLLAFGDPIYVSVI